jgi:predicted aspartyl protease
VQVKQKHILYWLVLAACPALVVAQQAPGWTTEGPFIDADEFSIELPMEVVATKLYVNVDIGGTTRRFVFDTGSPSMINAALAEELGLEVVDKQKGTDAHGVVVESNIVQADLVLDGVTLHKVPIFAADFSASKAAQCLVGDGVLGSEVLPLCAWQIDLPNSVLRCKSDVRKLDHVDGASRQALYNFGYPHTPYFDVQFAKKAKSKAMFDTGSPTYMAISPPDFEGAKQAGGIGKTLSGFGSAGGSLGGQAPNARQTRAELKTLAIGDVALGRVDATLRESAPSLIGAMLLDHFVVTLDTKSELAYFDVYRDGPFKRGDR